jgi:hypothetical protein
MISAAPFYIKAFMCAYAADMNAECAGDAFTAATMLTVNGEPERALECLQHAHLDLTAARMFASEVFATLAQCRITFEVVDEEGCNCT